MFDKVKRLFKKGNQEEIDEYVFVTEKEMNEDLKEIIENNFPDDLKHLLYLNDDYYNSLSTTTKSQIEKVVWKRCVDLNDRQLRIVETGLSGESKIVQRQDGFDITVASEIMAILCLSNDIKDLKRTAMFLKYLMKSLN